MLSKPKYMLPGNLSQGAPILEPDENGKYNFSFALDGDEIIKEPSITIYSLQGDELSDKGISLDLDDLQFDLISSNLQDKDGNNFIIKLNMRIYGDKEKGEDGEYQYIPYERTINFTPLENVALINHTEITLSFENYFKGISKEDFFIDTEYRKIEKSSYTNTFVEAYEPQAAILPILITKSGIDTSYDGDFMVFGPLKYFTNFSGTIPCLIELREDSKWYLKFKVTEIELSYSFSVKDFEDFNENFKNPQDTKYFPAGIYEVNPSVIDSLGTTGLIEDGDHYKQYYNFLTNPTTNLAFKGKKKSNYRYYFDYGGNFYYPSLFNNFRDNYLTYKDLSYAISKDKIYTLKDPQKVRRVSLTLAMSSENKEETFKIEKQYVDTKYLVALDTADFYSTPLTASTSPKIKNTIGIMLRINKPFLTSDSNNKITFKGEIKTTALEDTKCYEELQNVTYYPKNENGKYNFFTFSIDVSNLLSENKDYFWVGRVKNLKNETYDSDPQIFKIVNTKKEYEIFENIGENQFGVKTDNSFIDYDIVEYQYEIKNKKGIVYYKSPLIKSSNMQFAQLPLPPSVQDDDSRYSLYFTALNKDMRIIQLTKELTLSVLNPVFDADYNYNILTKEINIQLEKNGWETQNYIQNYTLMCCDEAKENYRIVKENISFEEIRNFSYCDIFNPYQKFYYFLVPVIKTWSTDILGDPYPQHSNFFYFENLPIDEWRLILTKEKKSDIIYSVDKVYDFYYNLVSGSIGNNAETTINTNFTNVPSVQKGFSNYWSGSLSALMGVCDEQGEFAQTIEQEKALEQLVLNQEHDKFLLDREGNIWQVEVSAPLTITNQDGLVQVDKLMDLKTITINWVQIGRPTQIIFNFEE